MKECLKLTGKNCRDGTQSFNSEVCSALLRLEGLGRSDGNWDGEDAVGAEVGDGDVGRVAQEGGGRGLPIGARYSDTVQAEGVWRGGGGLLPLDGAVPLLRSDAVVVPLPRQNLTASVVVALHTASGASEVLNTVSGGSKNIHSRNDILQ